MRPNNLIVIACSGVGQNNGNSCERYTFVGPVMQLVSFLG